MSWLRITVDIRPGEHNDEEVSDAVQYLLGRFPTGMVSTEVVTIYPQKRADSPNAT